ncbi:MAG: helix-turn-helix domain-containing protein [Anaeroplasmataceae bacterium]|nr:helix-turn-helix domain-containing protein [Anaeroplasmataceae bacterium]
MKKWILKAEVTKILNTYSIRKDEFEAIEKLEYCYQSKYVKGYMITLSEEENQSEKTGRILVSHTMSNGKKTYHDIWERDKDDNLQFRFRNSWNQPFSDADYIKDLEEQIQQLKQTGQKLQDQLALEKQKRNVTEKKVKESLKLPEYQKLKSENETLHSLLEDANHEKKKLLEQIDILKIEYQKLNNDTIHNARGAGRKPSKERLDSIEHVRTLLDEGHSDQEIIEKLGISRATFYRYKKNINS